MRKIDEMSRQELIDLIASNYGFGPNITEKLTDEVLRDTCKNSQPNIFLGALLALGSEDIFLEEYRDEKD